MKNTLILHGTNNNSQGNWFPWLKKELEKLDYLVWAPDLPESDTPNTKQYNKFLLKENDWQFNQDSLLVGHSSGAMTILGLLQALPKNTTVGTCILVGSFKDPLETDFLKGLFEVPFDFKLIRSKAKKFIFIHSNNDPYCPLDHAQFLAKQLGGELKIFKGQGHFNLEKGQEYNKFPQLLKIIKKGV